MKKMLTLVFFSMIIFGCSSCYAVKRYGQHYQKHEDYKSLYKVVDLIPLEVDTSYVKSILGDPIDMGFDYRYLVDSMGPNGCVIGAVFHIDDNGKIDQKWIGEICE